MKTLTLFTLTLMLTAAMAITTATAQQYVHTDTLTGHTGRINGLAFKDNGTLISGGWDDTLRAWDVTTGNQRWQVDVVDPVNAVALPTHDPFFIAYGGSGYHAIRIRYSDDGDFRGYVAGHTDAVFSLAFKPNSYRLASGSADNTIRIWDVQDRDNLRHVRTLRGHTDWVFSVAWSPDGSTLASGSRDGTVRLWNPNNGINFAVLRGHTANVFSVAWSPDGRILASGSRDNTIRIWNPDTNATLRVLRGHTYQIDSLVFHPNGQTLASGSYDSTIRLWNPNTGAHKTTLTGYADDINGLAFSPNGQILAGRGPRGIDISLYRLLTVDVDGDGILSYLDLVAVANKYGFTGTRAADVNKDRKVDIEDLIIVAKAIDSSPDAIDAADAAAIEAANADKEAEEDAEDDDTTDDGGGFPAPAKRDIDIGRAHLWAADVQQWLRDAKAANANPAGIAALEQLLATLNRQVRPVPKETALLANYPNPFNPETWIPYQLAQPAEVTVSIHSVDGKLVRALELGQMPAGVYQSRSRAAYWDGRNQLGEPVASGVYFYTLKAGEFSATRKMLIRK